MPHNCCAGDGKTNNITQPRGRHINRRLCRAVKCRSRAPQGWGAQEEMGARSERASQRFELSLDVKQEFAHLEGGAGQRHREVNNAEPLTFACGTLGAFFTPLTSAPDTFPHLPGWTEKQSLPVGFGHQCWMWLDVGGKEGATVVGNLPSAWPCAKGSAWYVVVQGSRSP